MTVRVYHFDEQLVMSNGQQATTDITRILLKALPGSLQVIKAHEANDRRGTDWWVERPRGRFVGVDCKVRATDWAAKPPGRRRDDLALETWSVVEASKIGWTLDPTKQTDYILWLWQDSGRWVLIPFPFLCAAFLHHQREWTRRFQVARQATPQSQGTYHSECCFVPRPVVWQAILDLYGGKPREGAGS